jgi:peroxiredoxin
MKKMLTAILVMLIVLSFAAAACQTEGTEIGMRAPDFELNTLDGQTVSLSELRGTPVLVNFWATWCGPCTYEMPFLQQVYDEWQQGELVMLAVNIGENANAVTSFMESYSLSLTVLLDATMEVALSYNIQYIPTTFFIDEKGTIQDIKVGAFSSVEEIESILSQLIAD